MELKERMLVKRIGGSNCGVEHGGVYIVDSITPNGISLVGVEDFYEKYFFEPLKEVNGFKIGDMVERVGSSNRKGMQIGDSGKISYFGDVCGIKFIKVEGFDLFNSFEEIEKVEPYKFTRSFTLEDLFRGGFGDDFEEIFCELIRSKTFSFQEGDSLNETPLKKSTQWLIDKGFLEIQKKKNVIYAGMTLESETSSYKYKVIESGRDGIWQGFQILILKENRRKWCLWARGRWFPEGTLLDDINGGNFREVDGEW